MGGPVVHKLLAVHPQAHAVVAIGVEGVGLGKGRLYLTGPSNREVIVTHRRIRCRTVRPVEVNLRIGTAKDKRVESLTSVVVSPHTSAGTGDCKAPDIALMRRNGIEFIDPPIVGLSRFKGTGSIGSAG